MKNSHILALDQGTSSSRAIIFNDSGDMVSLAQKEFTQYFPGQGLVEHDPEEIWSSQRSVMEEAVLKASLRVEDIAAIGITNQRETCIVWDASDGKPLCNAIVWQDRRTADFCEGLKASGMTEKIREKTGLVPDAYFSATKIRWILQNVPGAAARAAEGLLRFGTVDSWLVWKLTGGKVHVTDVSNASRTMLFNIREMKWDEDLLELFGIPFSMLPQVRSSSEVYGHVSCGSILDGVPVSGIAGDQQAALLGQMCTERGSMKCTYGTGCFLLMNCGTSPVTSSSNLLTTVAWKIGEEVNYAVEGSVFVAGSLVQWLRDGLGIIRSSSEVEALARQVPDNGGVYFVPALTGLGAPHWDPFARGAIYGIGRGTTAAHIARAALEGIACQTMDIVDAMRRDVSVDIRQLKVDGGASRNDLLMQIQADLSGVEVVRPVVTETTAFGAACLAALAVGFWDSLDSIRSLWKSDRKFTPQASPEAVRRARAAWADVVRRTLR